MPPGEQLSRLTEKQAAHIADLEREVETLRRLLQLLRRPLFKMMAVKNTVKSLKVRRCSSSLLDWL